MISIVPMQAIPNHKFSAVVPIDDGNVNLSFRLTYNELANCWIVDISKDETVVLAGLPMVPGQNILEQYAYLGIGSAAIVPRSEAQEQWPSRATLSADWYVVWGDTNAG